VKDIRLKPVLIITPYTYPFTRKKIAVVTNQSGVVLIEDNKKISDNKMQTHLVDFISKNHYPQNICTRTWFSGPLENIVDGMDSTTGLPIISLYGSNKKPTLGQLKEIDIMVFDLQDVETRFYLHLLTALYNGSLCRNIELIILDRPNPNGNIVDGPILEKEFTSFVGMHPIPVLHGMTIGEYSQMINGALVEKWNQLQANYYSLYNRKMQYSLPIKPSKPTKRQID
jgi:uncharacterized protein YbbC (DUF1343 family)